MSVFKGMPGHSQNNPVYSPVRQFRGATEFAHRVTPANVLLAIYGQRKSVWPVRR
jgi:hypothetical protein